jgi:hypothetical protein
MVKKKIDIENKTIYKDRFLKQINNLRLYLDQNLIAP